jgi:hypothetical protein
VPIRFLRPFRAGAAVSLAGLVVAVALGVTGCTSGSPAPSLTSTPTASSTSTPTPVATFGPEAPTPVALAHFNSVMQALLKSNSNPDGRAVIDALAAGGFAKKTMQLTPDTTTIGRTVDSIEFSVLWQNKNCLVGQIGTAGYGISSSPVLSTGKCLIGTTRPINW